MIKIVSKQLPNKTAAPLKKSWFKTYRASILGGIFMFFLYPYPYFIMFANDPPKITETEILRGAVLKAQAKYPNIIIETNNKDIYHLNFPYDFQFIYLAKYYDFRGQTDWELSRLANCNAVVHIDYVKWAIVKTPPRIWSLTCSKHNVPYDTLVNYHYKMREFNGERAFILIGILILLSLVIRADFNTRSN
jgi:hypothetical protein